MSDNPLLLKIMVILATNFSGTPQELVKATKDIHDLIPRDESTFRPLEDMLNENMKLARMPKHDFDFLKECGLIKPSHVVEELRRQYEKTYKEI